jgi:glycosyltransferase involved in cell wall biosynthesis
MAPKRVMISINASWNIYNFRAGLIRGLQQSGYEVVAAAPLDDYSARLEELGCHHVALPMDSNGSSPLKDGLLFLRYLRLLRRERPDVFLGYTIKPNIYGSLAARLLGIPVINNVSGLGTAFIHDTWLTRLVELLYRLALRSSKTIFFQNTDDRNLFVASKLARLEQTSLVPGSGVDLDKFRPQPSLAPPGSSTSPCFLLIARMLWDKGVGEYVEAARLVKKLVPGARFQLLGFINAGNPMAISRAEIDAWAREGAVEYLGVADDVRGVIEKADCVVLPSYREGTPRTLLEAAAMGKPLITTDAPGCRNVVDDGVNGFLCTVGDANDLAEKLITFASLNPARRREMGLASRLKAEAEFDERIVVNRYLAALEVICAPMNRQGAGPVAQGGHNREQAEVV